MECVGKIGKKKGVKNEHKLTGIYTFLHFFAQNEQELQ